MSPQVRSGQRYRINTIKAMKAQNKHYKKFNSKSQLNFKTVTTYKTMYCIPQTLSYRIRYFLAH